MILLEDKNQKPSKHTIKHEYWKKHGIEVDSSYRLPCGDYIILTDKVADVINRKNERRIPVKMMDFVGTYNVVVDTKKDIQELVSDICGKQHERFRDELIFAQNNGIKLYILVENEFEWINQKKGICNNPVNNLNDLMHWKNKRAFIWKNGKQVYPNATKGSALAKACMTIEKKYGCKFVFCRPSEAGSRVVYLLENGEE